MAVSTSPRERARLVREGVEEKMGGRFSDNDRLAIEDVVTEIVAQTPRVLVCPKCGATSVGENIDKEGGPWWSRAGSCHLGDGPDLVEPVEYVRKVD